GGGPSVPLESGEAGFSYLLGSFYWLLGPHPIIGVVANAALAAAIVPVRPDTTRRAVGEAAARRIPLLATCIPGFVLWPSLLLREAGVLLLLAIVANCSVRLANRTSPLAIAVTALTFPLLFTF